MNKDHHAAIRQAITRHTQRQLKRPVEELRAELEEAEKEIRDGWLGISDFIMKEHTPEHPAEPQGNHDIRYRGWLAGYSWQREYATGCGYTAVNAEDATNCTIIGAAHLGRALGANRHLRESLRERI